MSIKCIYQVPYAAAFGDLSSSTQLDLFFLHCNTLHFFLKLFYRCRALSGSQNKHKHANPKMQIIIVYVQAACRREPRIITAGRHHQLKQGGNRAQARGWTAANEPLSRQPDVQEWNGKPPLSALAWCWEICCSCSWLTYTCVIGRASPSGWLLKPHRANPQRITNALTLQTWPSCPALPVFLYKPGVIEASTQSTSRFALQRAQRYSFALQTEFDQPSPTSLGFIERPRSGGEGFECTVAALGHEPLRHPSAFNYLNLIFYSL